MPAKKLYTDVITTRHPPGTLDRLRAVLREGENLPDALREIVEAGIGQREAERDHLGLRAARGRTAHR